jgi:hypothetical protein
LAQRTTTTAVQTLLGANYGALPDGTSPSLQPYVDAATNLVDQVVTCATAKGTTIDATTLELIERWLSAYLYTRMDPLYKSRSTKDASGSFADYGYKETAISLDPSGCLAGILKGQTAGMVWLGKPPSSQINYVDRD